MKHFFYFLLLVWSTPVFSQNDVIDCDDATEIVCGVANTATSNGSGLWNLICGPSSAPTVGQESFFLFTPIVTQTYSIRVISNNIADSPSSFSYFIKEYNSEVACTSADWRCIGTASAVFTTNFDLGVLNAGVQYLILVDGRLNNLMSQTFYLSGCVPDNDFPQGAINIPIGTGCNGPFSNTLATKDPLEPDPDIDTTDGYRGRWLTTINRTVWFTFVAPASGSVTIESRAALTGTTYDTRIALYDVTEVNNYSTYKLIESDDNESNSNPLLATANASIPYIGLVAGRTYYVQVDGVGTNTLAEQPYFCLTVKNCVQRTNRSRCNSGFFNPSVGGPSAFPNNGWYGVYTQPAPGDLGEIVVGVAPNGQDLDTVFAQIRVFPTAQSGPNGVFFMPAYVSLRASKPETAPLRVRLFYSVPEFDSLRLKTGFLSANIGDINVSSYDGQLEDCTPTNNPVSGTVSIITAVDTFPMGCTRSFYLNFQANALGEFVGIFGSTSLPVELTAFSGKVLPKVNELTWTTASEQNVVVHIVERSLDALKWETVATLESKSTLGARYSVLDQKPVPMAYYRIRSVDNDSREQVSNIVQLIRRGAAIGIQGVAPNPTQADATIWITAAEEASATLRVTDLAGRVVFEQPIETIEGTLQQTVPMQHLPSGTYLVQLMTINADSTPVRVVKQ
jgi:hypothetical protein